MVDGKISALGSPMELKKKYATDNISDIFLLLARGEKPLKNNNL